MSLRENRITSDREQHTVYLTRELWEAVERQHLELRLRSSEPPSKIEFIEQVLRAGLHALAQGTGTGGALRSPHRPVPVEEATPAARRKLEPGPSVDPPVLNEPSRAERPVRPVPPVATPPKARRAGALQRLMQASEPGRPAAIRSAADVSLKAGDGGERQPEAANQHSSGEGEGAEPKGGQDERR